MKANQEESQRRRDFLRNASMATVAALVGGVRLLADEAPAGNPARGAKWPVNCGVIGLGAQGREILTALSRLPRAEVVAVCDTHPAMFRRAGKLAPQAKSHNNYQELLADQQVQAVLIATPTHKHREIVEAALAAGKHVYCEAPLAHTVADARAIAAAAHQHRHLVFQAGLQNRADYQNIFTAKLAQHPTGGVGRVVRARAMGQKNQLAPRGPHARAGAGVKLAAVQGNVPGIGGRGRHSSARPYHLVHGRASLVGAGPGQLAILEHGGR